MRRRGLRSYQRLADGPLSLLQRSAQRKQRVDRGESESRFHTSPLSISFIPHLHTSHPIPPPRQYIASFAIGVAVVTPVGFAFFFRVPFKPAPPLRPSELALPGLITGWCVIALNLNLNLNSKPQA